MCIRDRACHNKSCSVSIRASVCRLESLTSSVNSAWSRTEVTLRHVRISAKLSSKPWSAAPALDCASVLTI
eukprot:3305754-Amphidinium_carterae.2